VYTIAATILTAALAFGCGSDAGDSLVLQFQSFSDDAQNGQLDVVSQTSASVDVVQDLCLPGNTAEPFGETFAGATFVNREGADIVLDTITINNQPAGAAVRTRQGSTVIKGGRCAGNSSRQCALDGECGLGLCEHSETRVTFLLFDFGTKDTVSHGTFNIVITFSGIDSRNARFTPRPTNMTVTFEDFDHCPSTGGGQ
jgi:hypothetical protein